MAISNLNRLVGPFIGNGVTTAFAFNFKVFSAADLQVIRVDAVGGETVLSLTTHYSVTLNADQNAAPGGTVTLLIAPAASFSLYIASAVAFTQPLSLSNQGGFYPAVINDALDRAAIQSQQLALTAQKSLKFALSDAASNITLPTLASLKGNLLGFDPLTGNPIPAINIIDYKAIAASANSSAVAANSSAVASEVSHQATVTLQAAVAANVTIATNAAASAAASSAVLTRVCNPRGAWATATAYAVNDCVIVSSIAYFAPVAHTSTTWAADLAAGKWQVLQGLTATQMAASSGGSLIGYQPGRILTNPSTLQKLASEITLPSKGIASPNSSYSNTYSSVRWPRNIIFLGDSITYGYAGGVTHQQSPLGLLQSMLSNQTGWEQGNWPCGGVWMRWTVSAGCTYGLNGPIANSLIMPVGATASISGDYVDEIFLFFQCAVGAGSVEIRVNGVLVGTIATAGAATNDVISRTILAARAGAGSTVLLTCITAPVEITSVEINRVTLNTPKILSHSYPGYSTNQFAPTARLTSIKTCVGYGVQPNLFVVSLGTNDIFNPTAGYNSTSAQFEANLTAICTGLIGHGIVLCVPMRVNTAVIIAGETFENYRDAVYRVAKVFGAPVLDQSVIDLASVGMLQDGVHPTVAGYNVLAAYWYKFLLSDSVTDFSTPKIPLILATGITAAGAPYAPPTFTVSRGGIVRLFGAISVPASAFNSVLTTIQSALASVYANMGKPLSQKNLLAATFNGSIGGQLPIYVSTAGAISNLTATTATSIVSLDGITFSTME